MYLHVSKYALLRCLLILSSELLMFVRMRSKSDVEHAAAPVAYSSSKFAVECSKFAAECGVAPQHERKLSRNIDN